MPLSSTKLESVFRRHPGTSLPSSVGRYLVPSTNLCILRYRLTHASVEGDYFAIKQRADKRQPSIYFNGLITLAEFATYVYQETTDVSDFIQCQLVLAAVKGFRYGIWEGKLNVHAYAIKRIVGNHVAGQTVFIWNPKYDTYPEFAPVDFWMSSTVYLIHNHQPPNEDEPLRIDRLSLDQDMALVASTVSVSREWYRARVGRGLSAAAWYLSRSAWAQYMNTALSVTFENRGRLVFPVMNCDWSSDMLRLSQFGTNASGESRHT